jgi:hypothetical protein
MISLNDAQLDIVLQAARALPVEKRSDYLQRVAADLLVRHGYRFTDNDVANAAHVALRSLVQNSAA